MEKRTIKLLFAFSLVLLICFTSSGFGEDLFKFHSVWLANDGSPQKIALNRSGNFFVEFGGEFIREYSPFGKKISNRLYEWPPLYLGNKLTSLSPDARINDIAASKNEAKIYLSIGNTNNLDDNKIIVLGENNDAMFIGKYGVGDGEFQNPRGLAISADGKLYVADSNNYRIQVFNPDGTFNSKFGSQGSGLGQFNVPPIDVAINNNGTILVLDGFKIHQFSADGHFISRDSNNSYSSANAITVDFKGNAYIVDSGNNRIISLKPDGTQVIILEGAGFNDGQFSNPTDLAVDSAGSLYIVDQNNQRIQKFSKLLFNASPASPIINNAPPATQFATLPSSITTASITTTTIPTTTTITAQGSLTITSAPAPLKEATIGLPYRIIFTASGGRFSASSNPTAWSISAGKFPDWFRMSSKPSLDGSTSTYTLSGIPLAHDSGTKYDFTIRAIDDNGIAGEIRCSFSAK